MSIIIFIISLALLILVHEFGHFIVAKKSGIRVDEFGLGFPPKIFAKKWGEITYTLNAIPFGGFVRIFGENSHSPMSDIGEKEKSVSFYYKPKWIKALVLVAGVAMNIIFAWLLLSILFLQSDGIVMAFWKGTQMTLFLMKETILGLGAFFWNVVSFTADFSQISGPIGIASIFGEASILGFSHIIYLVALISINLAVINLLPLPALDGGRLLFVGIEGLIRKPISPTFVKWTNAVGFAFLIILMFVVTGNDILKLL